VSARSPPLKAQSVSIVRHEPLQHRSLFLGGETAKVRRADICMSMTEINSEEASAISFHTFGNFEEIADPRPASALAYTVDTTHCWGYLGRAAQLATTGVSLGVGPLSCFCE